MQKLTNSAVEPLSPLDTIFINVKNRERPYYRYSRRTLEAIDEGEVKALISAIVLAEMCTGSSMFPDLYDD
jgi:predicted nucleic acid-binding protein